MSGSGSSLPSEPEAALLTGTFIRPGMPRNVPYESHSDTDQATGSRNPGLFPGTEGRKRAEEWLFRGQFNQQPRNTAEATQQSRARGRACARARPRQPLSSSECKAGSQNLHTSH